MFPPKEGKSSSYISFPASPIFNIFCTLSATVLIFFPAFIIFPVTPFANEKPFFNPFALPIMGTAPNISTASSNVG